MRFTLLPATANVVAALIFARAAWPQPCVTPTDGMVITQSTLFCPGSYHLPNGITIAASGITVEGDSTEIFGDGIGYGLSCTGRNQVTVGNLTVRAYFHGLHFYDCDDLTVTQCNVWDTPELPQGQIFLNIFDGPNGVYAHAVWLRYCDRPTITYNRVDSQQNGISLFNCQQALLAGNYASYNSGWGIYLWDTDYSTVGNNTADYCTRLYYGWSGADAASILIVYGSDYNTIVQNSFVGGGDGVFLAGATHSLQHKPNNYNYFARNDCSRSPNNGFEATFSRGNVFEDNISDDCNYGYWLGYSWENEIRGNRANSCTTAGIAIEHGHSHVIANNMLNGNGRGIWLWTDNDVSLLSAFPWAEDSYDYTIDRNTIMGNVHGLYCEAADVASNPNLESYDYRVTDNTFWGNGYAIRLIRTTDSTVCRNVIRSSSIRGVRLEWSGNNLLYDNVFHNLSNASDNSPNTWNIAKTAGINIIGGPYLGGNFWSDYGGVDLDGDGLGDTELPHTSSGAISTGGDWRPLVPLAEVLAGP